LATTKAAGVTVEIRGAVCIGLCEIMGADTVIIGRGDLTLIPPCLGLVILLLDSGSEELTLVGTFVDLM